jgi:NAD(P)-dependent dehydrogenase (short-subunit alcohol dehydrogenase family)
MNSSIQDLAGRVFVVTGANSGIGYEAAKRFASRGARLALVCRSEERGRKALDAIASATDNPDVKLYLADFCSLASVAKVASELLQDYPQIDVLCNNAGSINASRQVTAEGFETTFVANHLSGFLLTYRLLPALVKAGENSRARVVFTSSVNHRRSALDFGDLNLEENYGYLKAYGRSKLMNLLTAREIHRRHKDDNIVASSFCPGGVRTPIWRKGGISPRIWAVLLYPFMVNAEKGAATLIWLAGSEDDDSINADGNFFIRRRRARIAPFATDEAAEELWQASLDLISPYLPDDR